MDVTFNARAITGVVSGAQFDSLHVKTCDVSSRCWLATLGQYVQDAVHERCGYEKCHEL